MSDTTQTSAPLDLPGLVTEEADRFRPAASRSLVAGLVVIAIIVCAAIFLPANSIQKRQDKLVEDLRNELQLVSGSRAEVIATWLEGTARLTERLVDSELLRLFATELEMAGGNVSGLAAPPAFGDEPSLDEQIPYMEQVVSDFVRSVGFFSAALIGRGQSSAYLTSAGAAPLTPAQVAVAKAVLGDGNQRFGPARDSAQGLVIDLVIPVAAAQSVAGDSQPVAAMLFTLPIATELRRLLARSPAAEPGERLSLIQRNGEAIELLAPGDSPAVRAVDPASISPETLDERIPFALREGLGAAGMVYSAGTQVAGSGFWVLKEVLQEAAEAPLRDHIRTMLITAALVVGVVIAAFGAFWWRLANEHNKARAAQFRHLAGRIDQQKRLLDSVNNTIPDSIGLKDRDGAYRYVNPAFARTVGRSERQIIGMDDAALFGSGTAERLKVSDDAALATGKPVTVDEQIYLNSRKHHFQISKVPLTTGKDGETGIAGLVSVARDVTELVEQRERRERAVEHMVTTLVRAVELRDPYLAGHSRRVAGLAAEVARTLGGSAELVATVEIAANLSQIGKLAVPREILNKPGRLDPGEIAVMEQHVAHAESVLRGVDFDLPVVDAIVQMHERLDGTGYPKGLAGDEISLGARILGACDVFCARVEPRSYRAGIAADKALEILAGMPERYDAAVVAALAKVVHSVAGEKLLCGCETI